MAIREMIRDGCEEVALEAEVCNSGALKLYQAMGFIRDKRLSRCGTASSGWYCPLWEGKRVNRPWASCRTSSCQCTLPLKGRSAGPTSSS